MDNSRREKRRQENKERTERSIFFLACVVATIIVALIVRGITIKVTDYQERKAQASAPPPVEVTLDAPPATQQNDLLQIATTAKGFDTKVCYLTFDDGPTPEVTPRVLDVLRDKNVKATFFMLGKMIERNPDIAKRVYNEGHLLSNHTYSHDYNSLYATKDSFMAEVNNTQKLIDNITNNNSFKLIRFPGGSQNAGKYGSVKQEYKHTLQENEYYFADWNALNGDAEANGRTPEQLLNRIKETAKSNNIVVLMHDAATKGATADSLASTIDYLREQGYEFKRLDEVKYYGKENGENPNKITLVMD